MTCSDGPQAATGAASVDVVGRLAGAVAGRGEGHDAMFRPTSASMAAMRGGTLERKLQATAVPGLAVILPAVGLPLAEWHACGTTTDRRG